MSERLHPRAKRLQNLYDIALRAQQQALGDYGNAQQTLSVQQQQMTTLEQYAQDYRQRLATPSASLSAGDVQSTLVFIRQIEQGMVQQKEQVAQWSTRVNTLRERYLEARAKASSFETLMDKLDQDYRQQQDKQEQRDADEWNSQMALRRKAQQEP